MKRNATRENLLLPAGVKQYCFTPAGRSKAVLLYSY